mgnify:CR=1 FL=1
MITKIILEEKPVYMIVAFDKGKTFRHDKYEEYKAGRQAMPDELKLQFPKAKEVLDAMGIKHFEIENYPYDIPHIVSDEGFGKNDYIETTRPLVVITAPGPGSGKMATCLSQLYHEHKRGIKAGYAKFETFPIWNLRFG